MFIPLFQSKNACFNFYFRFYKKVKVYQKATLVSNKKNFRLIELKNVNSYIFMIYIFLYVNL